MSTTVEQRVVSFMFNNSDFEKNVSQSINTLDKLKKTVDDSTSGKSFEGLSQAAKKLDFSGVTETITTITSKFSALEEIAIGALRNIGASIQQHLVNGLKAATIDNVAEGFTRFGQKTESVATIMAAIADEDYGDVDKLEYVNGLLNKLAWFSDETSYNFTDMTDNISKFVSAGLDLDTSTTAMMGIANWAAQAGQDANVASRAMYQLSQAMGMGSIKLMDWKSIEVANMATKEVKQMLIDYGKMMSDDIFTAEDGITYIREMTEKGEEKLTELSASTFRETLSTGWLTSDIFAEAMGEYASYAEALNAIINNENNADLGLYATDLMSKMDAALEKSKETGETLEDIMMQDYGIDIMVTDENGNLVSAMADVTELGMRALESAQKARTFGQAIDSIKDAASTKWSQAFETIFGNMEEATELWSYLAEVLYEWFAEPLNLMNDVLADWKDAGGRDSLFGYISEDGEEVNGALQNIIEAIDTLKGAIGEGIGQVFDPITGDKLAELTDRFREFTEGLILNDEAQEKVTTITSALAFRLKEIWSIVSTVTSGISRMAGQVLSVFKDVFSWDSFFSAGSGSWFSSIVQFFSTVGQVVREVFGRINISSGALDKIKTILTGFNSLISILITPLKIVTELLGDIFWPSGDDDLDEGPVKKIADFLGGSFLEIIMFIPSKIATLLTSINDFIQKTGVIPKIAKKIREVFGVVADFVGKLVKQFATKLNLDASGSTFDTIVQILEHFWDKIVEVAKKVKDSGVVTTVVDFIKNIFDKIKGIKPPNTTGLSTAFQKVKNFISGLFGGEGFSLGGSKKIDLKGIKEKVLPFIETLSGALGPLVKKLPAFLAAFGVFKAGKGIENIGSVGTSISKLFSSMSETLSSVGDSVTELSKGYKIKSIGSAVSSIIKSMGVFLLAVAAAVVIISMVKNPQTLADAMQAMAWLIAEVVLAMVILVKAVGKTSIKASALAGIALTIAAMGVSILLIASAVKKMAEAVNDYGSDKISEAMLCISILLAEVVGLMILMSKFGGKTKGGAGSAIAILGAAVAMLIMVKVIKQIAKIKKKDLTKGLIAIAGLSAIIVLLGQTGRGNKNILRASVSLLILTGVIELLVLITKQLSKMDTQALIKGELALLGLAVIMNIMGQVGRGNNTLILASAAMILLSAVVEILVLVVKQLGEMDTSTLVKGELALAGIVLIMLGMGQIGKGNKTLILAAAALTILSANVVILATVVQKLGELSLETLAKGLVSLEIIVLIMTQMSKIGKHEKNLLKTSAALTLMSASVLILSTVVANLGALSLEELAIGLAGLEIIVLIMGQMAKVGKNEKHIASTGAALTLMSAAAGICAIIVSELGKLDEGVLWQGLAALEIIVLIMGQMAKIGSKEKSLTKTAAALTLMSAAAGIAALVVEKLAEIVRENDFSTILAAMLIFAGIIAVFVLAQKIIGDSKGTAILAIAAAVIALSLALLILVKAIEIFIDILIKLGNDVADNKDKIIEGVEALGEILEKTAPTIEKIFKQMVEILLKVLGSMVENIAKGIVELLVKVLKLIKEYGPEILKLLKTILKDILDFILEFCEDELLPGLQQLVSDILTVLFNLLDELWTDIKAFITRLWTDIKLFLNMALIDIKTFLNRIVSAIEEVVTNILDTIDRLVTKLTETITSIIDSIATMLSDIITIISDKLLEIVTTIKNTLVGEDGQGGIIGILSDLITDVIDAAINLGEAIITGIIDGLADLVTKVHDSLVGEDGQGGLIGALKSLVTDVIAAALDLGAAIITGIIDGLADLVTRVKNSLVGEDGQGGLIGALKDLVTDVIDAALELGKAVITGIIDGLADLVTEVTNSLVGEDGQGGIIGALKESVTKITTAAIDLGASIITNIIDGLGDLVTKVKNSLVGEDGKGGIVKGISDCITDVVTAVATLAGEIVKGLLDGISTIADDLHDGLVGEDGQGGLVKALCDVAKDLAPGVAAIVKALMDGLMDSVGTIVDTLVEMIVGKKDENGNVIKRGVLQYIDTILDAICQVLEWIPTAIKKYSKRIENAGWDILDAILSSIPLIGALWDLGRDAVKSLIGGIEDEADKYKDIDVMEKLGLGEGAVKELGKQGYRDRYHMFGADLITALMTGIQEKNPDALEALDLACEGLIDEARAKLGIKSPSTVFKDIGKNVDLGLAEGMTDNEGKINKSAAALLRSLKGQFTSEETRASLATTGEKVTKYISKGFISETSASSVSSAVQKMLRGVTTATKDSKDMISTSGMYVDKYVASGVKNKDNKQPVLDAVVSLAGAMLASFKGVDFTSSGDNFVSGVTSGIEHSAYLARQKAVALARDTKWAFDQELEIASPSKKMMESGRFFDMGLAKGIDKYSKDPIESSEDVADALALAMTAALYMAQAALQDEDYTPVITPVVDLTDVQNGVYQMGNLFGAYDGYSVDAAFGSRYNPYEYYDGSEKRDPTLDLLGSVDGVTSKLDQMINKLTQLKVYLDSGALVGGIYEQVDNSLGKKAIYAGRSVI